MTIVRTHCDSPMFLAAMFTLQLLGVCASTDNLNKVVTRITAVVITLGQLIADHATHYMYYGDAYYR